jgi:hypothetical protein
MRNMGTLRWNGELGLMCNPGEAAFRDHPENIALACSASDGSSRSVSP